MVESRGFTIYPGSPFIRPDDGMVSLLVESNRYRPYSDVIDLNCDMAIELGRKVFLDAYEDDFIDTYMRLYGGFRQ